MVIIIGSKNYQGIFLRFRNPGIELKRSLICQCNRIPADLEVPKSLTSSVTTLAQTFALFASRRRSECFNYRRETRCVGAIIIAMQKSSFRS